MDLLLVIYDGYQENKAPSHIVDDIHDTLCLMQLLETFERSTNRLSKVLLVDLLAFYAVEDR